jgi:hypothetical protein
LGFTRLLRGGPTFRLAPGYAAETYEFLRAMRRSKEAPRWRPAADAKREKPPAGFRGLSHGECIVVLSKRLAVWRAAMTVA